MGLRVFVAALAVVDDILSLLTLAIFYPQAFTAIWLLGSAAALAALYALNRARVYVGWPYVVVTIALWLTLHAAGVHGALAGVLLAAFLPTRPTPAAGPLLAQAATALAELEHAESELKESGDDARQLEKEPIWDWASRNLSAASHRLLSPADRFERAVAPWSTHLVLPLVRLFGDGHRALGRSIVARCCTRSEWRGAGPCHRQAARHFARSAAGDQAWLRPGAGGRQCAPIHRRRLPLRHRRYGRAVDGRSGLSRRIVFVHRQDRRADRLGAGGSAGCGNPVRRQKQQPGSRRQTEVAGSAGGVAGENAVDLGNHRRTLAHRCRNPLGRAGAHIADGKDTGSTGLQR